MKNTIITLLIIAITSFQSFAIEIGTWTKIRSLYYSDIKELDPKDAEKTKLIGIAIIEAADEIKEVFEEIPKELLGAKLKGQFIRESVALGKDYEELGDLVASLQNYRKVEMHRNAVLIFQFYTKYQAFKEKCLKYISITELGAESKEFLERERYHQKQYAQQDYDKKRRYYNFFLDTCALVITLNTRAGDTGMQIRANDMQDVINYYAYKSAKLLTETALKKGVSAEWFKSHCRLARDGVMLRMSNNSLLDDLRHGVDDREVWWETNLKNAQMQIELARLKMEDRVFYEALQRQNKDAVR